MAKYGKKLIYLDCTQISLFETLVGQLVKNGNNEIISLFRSLKSSYELLRHSDIFKDTKYLDLWLFNLDVARKFFIDLGFDICPILFDDYFKM